MSRHRDFRNLNINDELDDDALSDGGEEPMTQEEENELHDALEQVRQVIGSAQASGIFDKELKDCLWHEYYDVNKAVDWALAEQERRRAALERKDSALEYFRSRNLDTNEDQSRVPKIILAQQQAYEQDDAHDPYEQGSPDPASEYLDSPYPGQYRPELSTITERSEIITESSPAWPRQSLPRPTRRGEDDSSRTTSYGEILPDDSQTQRFFLNVMGEETPRQQPTSLPTSSTLDSSGVPSIRMSSATTTQASDSTKPALPSEKPLPERPPSTTPKKSKLSSLASSRSSAAASSLSASSRNDGTALTGSVKTFPTLRPSSQSELSPSTWPPSLPSKDHATSSRSSTSSGMPSQATGVSEMTAQVQKAIQAALQLEAMDQTVVRAERPKLTLAQSQSPPPAKGVSPRALQTYFETPTQQSPKFTTTPQHQRLTDENLKSPSKPKAAPSPLDFKPQTPVQTPTQPPGETKSDTSPGKPMSKLAKLAQQKVSATKAPRLPATKTEYFVPTANGGTATTAITTSYQSLFSLTDPKRSTFMPKLDVVPISTIPAIQQMKTSKLAMKAKKASDKPAVKVPVEESEETFSASTSPIFQPTARSRASPSAFASVLMREDLVMFKTSKRSKDRLSDQKSPVEEQEKGQSSYTAMSEAIVPNPTAPSAFAFDSPSPDDIVFNARRGTSLAQSKRQKSTSTSTLSSRT